MYNAREHPKYKNGEMTEKEVFESFLKSFEPNDEKDGKVSESSWFAYCQQDVQLITDRLSVGMTEGQLFESSPGVCMHHVVSLERTLSYFTLPLSTQGDKMCCVLRQDT